MTATFQLIKTYRSGEESYDRPIAKPVPGSVRMALGHLPKVPDLEFTVDETRGLVTFEQAPDLGVAVNAGFEFDVPVRFDTERIDVSVSSFQAGEVPAVPVVEVRV